MIFQVTAKAIVDVAGIDLSRSTAYNGIMYPAVRFMSLKVLQKDKKKFFR